jgi:hypothetical protein
MLQDIRINVTESSSVGVDTPCSEVAGFEFPFKVHLSLVLCGFPQTLQKKSEVQYYIGHDDFVPHHFQSIIHNNSSIQY